jgi:glycosyltransferase involved in cell wall biosynthesis
MYNSNLNIAGKSAIKIATLMAVYHGDNATALDVAIRSVAEQALSDNIESHLYLAVDGPVSPEIDQILLKHQNNIFCLLRLERNSGLAAALNALIRNLKDEVFIFRMDADDRSYPTRYQTQLNYLELHPDIDIVGTDIIEFVTKTLERRRVSFSTGPDDALKKLCWRVPVAHATVCLRRRVLDRIGGYPETGSNEDISLWFRCARAGFKFDNIHESLYEVSVAPNFWNRRGVKKAFSEFYCYTLGIWSLHGITWKYILPLLRFILRLSPQWFSRYIYGTGIRRSTKVN